MEGTVCVGGWVGGRERRKEGTVCVDGWVERRERRKEGTVSVGGLGGAVRNGMRVVVGGRQALRLGLVR